MIIFSFLFVGIWSCKQLNYFMPGTDQSLKPAFSNNIQGVAGSVNLLHPACREVLDAPNLRLMQLAFFDNKQCLCSLIQS